MAQFSYNGIDLQSGSLKCRVTSNNVLDDAGRVVTHVKSVIEAVFVVQADAGTNVTLLQLRSALSKAGAPLIFEDKGFSSLSCNSPGKPSDVKAGPVPEILSWTPIGDSQACEVAWRCTVCLGPICQAGQPIPSSGIMATNYEATFNISPRGFTTRILSGYIEVAVARLTPNNTLSDCADQYRTWATINVPPGFTREQTWNTDPSKSRLTFSIVDKQIESPYAFPDGYTHITAGHDVTWSASQRSILRQTFDLQCEQKPAKHKAEAYALFLKMALQRINAAKTSGTGRFPWIEAIRVSDDDIFSYRSSFSVQWRIIGCLNDIVSPSGIWTPVDSNFNTWRTSMADAFGLRGYAGMGISAANDLVVNLCNQTMVPWPDQDIVFPSPAPLLPTSLANEQPPAQYSWIEYDFSVIPGRDQPVVRQSPLQTPTPMGQQGSMDDTDGLLYEASQGVVDIIQKGGNPRYWVKLIGRARRAGHKIPRPILSALGGVSAEEVDGNFVQKVSMAFGAPVYSAAWVISYMLSGPPNGAVTPPQNKEDDACKKVGDTILQ